LVGTIANARGKSHHDLGPLIPDAGRPAERFFLAIKPGDTPDNSEPARLAVAWIDEWLFNMRAAFGPKDPA
jgi:hypothetical protein